MVSCSESKTRKKNSTVAATADMDVHDDNKTSIVYRTLALTALVVIGGGTVFYHYVERFSWIDAYYFCVVTLATVGYGDLVPHTTIGKLFTTFYIFIGVGIFTLFISHTLRRRAQKNATIRGKSQRKVYLTAGVNSRLDTSIANPATDT